MSIITLLTDFGVADEYVGVMKGVILSLRPHAAIVDISHQIAPQNVLQAATMLQSAYPYFPAGTVHIVVVDPGVGTDRGIIAAKAARQIFVAPDNGVLTVLMDGCEPRGDGSCGEFPVFQPPCQPHVSWQGHIRAGGGPPGQRCADQCAAGPEIHPDRAIRLDLPKPFLSDRGELLGAVVDVDRFGNLITCIPAGRIDAFCPPAAQGALSIRIGGHAITGIAASYSSVPLNRPLAVIGSRGVLEIAVNCGSAQKTVHAGVGDTVKLVCPRSV